MNVVTELILAAPVHQQRVVWGCMYDVTLKNRVKGINWHTAVFIALFHVGAVAALFVFNWKAVLIRKSDQISESGSSFFGRMYDTGPNARETQFNE